jgi:parallel beta-helix repeat protein
MTDHPVVPTDRRALLAGIGGLAAGTFLASGRAEAGPLNPPSAPAPTGKTLTEVEPRIAINSTNTPGNVGTVYLITVPGSYYLEKNLEGESGKHGILIVTDDVTVDLRGFLVLGVTGSLSGIVSQARHNVSVKNGVVRGWGNYGVDLWGSSQPRTSGVVEHVMSVGNGLSGFRVNGDSVVRQCMARLNGGIGFEAQTGAVFDSCTASENTSHGIRTGSGCSVVNCLARSNGGDGISANESASISHCSTNLNSGNGFAVGNTSVISHCVARNNLSNGISMVGSAKALDNVAVVNIMNGITMSSNCTISGNHCQNNGSAGIVGGSGNRIEGNECRNNGTGIQVTQSDNFIARNICSENSANDWNISNTNVCLVVEATTTTGFTGSSGGVSPGSMDPNANFTI